MKISTRWLARHVDLAGLSAEEIAEGLTLSTAEVEGVERFLPHLSEVVVGHVVERAKHPDADKLSFCQVDVGGPEILGIVCGASNVAAGQKVAVARIGTKLPGDLTIKKAKIRGVESCGMICSERELGLGDEHSGIWVLPAEAPIGRPVAESLGLDDWTIEIENKSLTHRPDLWGHRGMAGEVAAIFRRKLLPLDVAMPAAGKAQPFPVRIETPACRRYLAVSIDGLRGGDRLRRSPDWLRALLLAVGQRPIDLLVDLSNFVMLDLGQPNHLFDRSRLSPEGIVVRMARAGETMKTLDGIERHLGQGDMLVCSGPEPVALAGVMGGEGSKVSPETTSLLLEVASFHPATVRRTAQRLALRTDSSARFEKSLDPTLPLKAAGHFLALLRALEPGVALPAPPTDAGDWKDPARTIRLRGERVRGLLGAEIQDGEIEDILRRLGFEIARAGDVFDVHVPSARATKDLTLEQDLVEEIGRIHRYGKIPERALVGELSPPTRDSGWQRRHVVRSLQDRLAGGAHFHETISDSFLSDDLLSKIGVLNAPHVQVVNPAAEGLSRIRRSVLPSLLAALPDNRRRGDEVRVFEIGKGYRPWPAPNAGARPDSNAGTGASAGEGAEPIEVHQCALVWAAPRSEEKARFNSDPLILLKGVLEDLFLRGGWGRPEWKERGSGEDPSWAHPGRCLFAELPSIDSRQAIAATPAMPAAAIPAETTSILTLAPLDPLVGRRLGLVGDLAGPVACAEISIDLLLTSPRSAPGYVPIPKFPAVKLDVAASLPLEVQAARFVDAIVRAGKGWVASSELFDVYTGPSLGPGRKSLAFHLDLSAEDRTLTEQDLARFLERLEREVGGLGGELRRA